MQQLALKVVHQLVHAADQGENNLMWEDFKLSDEWENLWLNIIYVYLSKKQFVETTDGTHHQLIVYDDLGSIICVQNY